jgi:methylglutaconyl-CoA hydratase
LRLSFQDDWARVDLDRPNVRNAFDERMIAELTDVFDDLPRNDSLRAVVLGGTGAVFCAGADIDWMRRSADRTEAENVADARAMATMFHTIDKCPLPVIARVQKAAFGGALGLLAASDIVVAEAHAKFCFSEVRLGLIPAVISSLTLAKIGQAQARRYFLTAEVFSAETAPAGLIHEVVTSEKLDARIADFLQALRDNGPQAVREIKALIPRVSTGPDSEALDISVRAIARVRTGAEAQAGLRAFLDKDKPPWQSPSKESS